MQDFLKKEEEEFLKKCEIRHFEVGEIDQTLILKFIRESHKRLLAKVVEMVEGKKIGLNKANRRGAHFLGEDYNLAIDDIIKELKQDNS